MRSRGISITSFTHPVIFIAGCVLIFFFSACDSPPDNKPLNYKQFLTDSIKVPFSGNPEFSAKRNIHTEGGIDYLVSYDRKDREIYLFDLSNEKLIRKVPLPEDIKKDEIGIDIKTTKQFYVLYSYRALLRLIDDSGQILKEWKMKEALTEEMGFPLWRMESGRDWQFRVIEGKLYCYAYKNKETMTKKQREESLLESSDYLIDLKGEKIIAEKVPCIYPKLWVKYRLKYSSGPLRYFGKNNTIVNCAVHTDTCYIYNQESGKTDTVRTEIPSFSEAYDFDSTKYFDYNYVIKYLNENDRYNDLTYDPYRDCFYRLLAHGFKYNEDGSRPDILKINYSLGIYDNEFNFLKEVHFPYNSFNPHNLIPVKEGVLIGKDAILKRKKFQLHSINYGLFRFENK